MKILDTERLTLRTVDLDDAPFYLGLVNQPSFIEFIGDRGIRTLDAARAAIEASPIAMQAERGHSLYLVELADSRIPIGMCGLIKRDTLDDVDIGYAFLPEYCGQGYALEAARAVLEHARAIGLPRVVAITKPSNETSNRLLGKLGLQFQKLAYLTPEDPGTNLYAIDLAAPATAG